MSFKSLYQQSPPELKKIVIDQWKAKQNPKYHPEGNTLKHIILVTNRAFRDFPDNKDIQLAAYFHDLGKLSTYDINPKTGQPTAYYHEKESVNLIDKFNSFIKQQGANPEIVKYIVQNHMRIKPDVWNVMKTSKKDPIMKDPNYQNLEKFSTIDIGGISEEFKRMQKLAGIRLNEDVSQEIQTLIDKNDFLKGKVKATPSDVIEGDKFVLLFSEDAAKHIAERHLDGNKPGSLFKSGINLRDVAKKILNISPSEQTNGRVKWLGVNGGNVGEMGVAKASPEDVAKMKDYTMPDGAKEQIKIAPGKRKPTNEVSLITAELGTLGNGKKALSMITMFPGGTKVDGVEIPMDRGEFASKGLYFVVDSTSPLLKENILKIVNEVLKKYRNQLNEGLDISNSNYELPDFEEKKTALNQMFPDGDIDTSHYQYFGYDSEEELRDAIGFGEVDSFRITNALQNATETIFPEEEGFKVDASLYYGDEKGNVSIVKGDDTLDFNININI